MRFISEEPETPRQREAREKLERAGVFKSKEQKRREKEKAKEEARKKDYEQKQKTLEYKRERLQWQKERSELKDKREAEKSKGISSKSDIISDKDKDPTAYRKAISSVASFGSSLIGSGIGPARDAIQKMRERKKRKEDEKKKSEFTQGLEKEFKKKKLPPSAPVKGLLPSRSGSSIGRRARQDPEFKKQEMIKRGSPTKPDFKKSEFDEEFNYEFKYSCWREEFIYELGEMRRNKKKDNDEDRKIDVMKGTNKITISPTIQEKFISERKRDQLTNALFALSFAANAAQSPQALVRSGHIEGPSMQLMSRMMSKRKKATVSGLDNARVSHPARNIKKEEFVKKSDVLKTITRRLINESKSKDNMKCNKPERAPKGAKQKYIVKACDNGRTGVLRFGYRGMQDFLQHKDPERRRLFKARHRCSEKNNKLTPGWWACNYNW